MKLTIEVQSGSSLVRTAIKEYCAEANPSAILKTIALGVDSFLANEEDNKRDDSARVAREFLSDLEALQRKWKEKEDAWPVEEWEVWQSKFFRTKYGDET